MHKHIEIYVNQLNGVKNTHIHLKNILQLPKQDLSVNIKQFTVNSKE